MKTPPAKLTFETWGDRWAPAFPSKRKREKAPGWPTPPADLRKVYRLTAGNDTPAQANDGRG